MAALAPGDLVDPLGEILVAIIDHVIAAVLHGEFALLARTDRADHRGAEMPGPLAGDQADTAGGSVEEDGVAFLHAVGPAQKVLRRHAFQHHRGSGLVIDAGRRGDDLVGLEQTFIGIGAERPAA